MSTALSTDPNGEEYYEVRGHKVYPNRKIALCGFASSSRNLAPFGDPSFKIAGLNSLYPLIPRFDLWYEIHALSHVQKNLQRAELQALGLDHYEWLTKQPGPGQDGYKPIFMQDHYPEIPASVKWPRQEINEWARALIGSDLLWDYFTSTPGQMVATAIYQGYGEIHLYGVDLLQSEEYAYQRPGCEAWCALATGLGIKVVVPKESALFKANYVYGYSEPAIEFGAVGPLVKFTEDKGAQIEQAQHQEAAVMNTVNGARQLVGACKSKIEAVTLAGKSGREQIEAKAQLLDELVTYLKLEETNLQQRFDLCRDNLNKLGGQRELAVSMASWIGHWGRGGLLEGMAPPAGAIRDSIGPIPALMQGAGSSEAA